LNSTASINTDIGKMQEWISQATIVLNDLPKTYVSQENYNKDQEELNTVIGGKVAQGDFNALSKTVSDMDKEYKDADKEIREQLIAPIQNTINGLPDVYVNKTDYNKDKGELNTAIDGKVA